MLIFPFLLMCLNVIFLRIIRLFSIRERNKLGSGKYLFGVRDLPAGKMISAKKKQEKVVKIWRKTLPQRTHFLVSEFVWKNNKTKECVFVLLPHHNLWKLKRKLRKQMPASIVSDILKYSAKRGWDGEARLQFSRHEMSILKTTCVVCVSKRLMNNLCSLCKQKR